MSWIQNKWALKSIFRLRKDNSLFKWYYIKQLIGSIFQIIDGIIEVITLNYVISDLSIIWLCVIPDHFFHERYMKKLDEELEKELDADKAEFIKDDNE